MPFADTYVAILDIGHGNCTVVFDRGNTSLVDCGPGSYILEFLIAEGITHIENVFLSHADQDHIEGLIALLAFDQISIDHVYLNSDGIKDSNLWDDVTYTASKSSVKGGTVLHAAITRTEGKFSCGELIIETMGPSAYLAAKSPGSRDRQGRKITSNSISASFKLIWNNEPIAYLAGDIDEIALDDMIDHGINIQAPLIVYPHHGGNTGKNNIVFTEALCKLTGCETVIFSIGRNKELNPRKEVVAAVRKSVQNVRIACTQLSKHCAPNNAKKIPTHLSNVFSRGKALNECCSGTFIIELGQSITYIPDTDSHQAFIAAVTISPLCMI